MRISTVITPGYLAFARVLARSLTEHEPGARLTVLAVDDELAPIGADEPFEVVRPAEVGVGPGELARRRLLYAPAERTFSLKAAAMGHLLERGGPVLHLDADCLVTGALGEVADLAAEAQVTLSPHSPFPAPILAERPLEHWFLRYGTFNAGVFGVGPRGRPFLAWLDARTRRGCVTDDLLGLHHEQGWLSLAPALFDHRVIRDPGVNVSGWNVFDRDIDWTGDAPAISGGPLRLFHFCGRFDPERPEEYEPGGGASPWPPLSERPGVARICREYADRLLAAGHRETSGTPDPYASLPAGPSVDEPMRAIYRRELVAAELGATPEPPNPFLTGQSAEFLRWLSEPPPGSDCPRYVGEIRARRPDVALAFPDVPGSDSGRFLTWVAEAMERGEISLPAGVTAA